MLNLMCGTTIFYNAMIDNSFNYTKPTWTARCCLLSVIVLQALEKFKWRSETAAFELEKLAL